MIRINKFISESGLCSRREADKLLSKGVVTINGKRAPLGAEVKDGDVVKVNGRIIASTKKAEKRLVLALNKPTGVVSTTDETDPNNIVSFVNYSERIFPIGRLDKDSQGLIFMTNDGDLVNKILRAGNEHEKEYLVSVGSPITESFLTGMRLGVPILGQVTKKCKVEQESPISFRITLTQGLNRQIRRMCEYFGYQVVKLERIRIMHIHLKGIPLGEFRELTNSEMEILLQTTASSSNEKKRATKVTKEKKPSSKIKSEIDKPVVKQPLFGRTKFR
jgi:23S rRNA pseudouridine2604 synthase